MSYGYPVGRSVVGSIFTDDKMLGTDNILELTRLFIYDGYGKNIESFSISKSLMSPSVNSKEKNLLKKYSNLNQIKNRSF